MPKDKYLYDYSTQDRRRIALRDDGVSAHRAGPGHRSRAAHSPTRGSRARSRMQYLNALAMTAIDAMKLGRGRGDGFSRHQLLRARQGRSRLRTGLARRRRTR